MSSEEVPQQEKKNTRCFFNITIANKSEGKIIFELFDNVCPRTVENFRSLCVGDKGLGQSTQKPLHFKGCPFHRIIKNFMIQGGDFSNQNGTGGESIYGEKFEDENFVMKHDKPGLLSMANAGPNTNGSQFFITCKATPHLDGKHVVFGKVIKGMGLVKKMENLETENDKPKKQCVIENCGVIPDDEEISNEVIDDGTGDIYSDSPEESGVDFTKFNEVADIAEKIKVIGNEQFKLGNFEVALEKYSKALSYIDNENSDGEMSSSSEDDEEKKNDENKKDKVENIKNGKEDEIKRYKSIFVPCHLNSAACYLKLKDYNNALESCNEVIEDDGNNIKALFRRGQAYTGLQDYDTALVDLNAAHTLAPTDKGILNEITRVKKLIKNYKESEKKKYSKLFS